MDRVVSKTKMLWLEVNMGCMTIGVLKISKMAGIFRTLSSGTSGPGVEK